MAIFDFPSVNFKAAWLCGVFACALPAIAHAGALTDAAAKAESLAGAGDAVGAYDVMRGAVSDFSANLPFSIGKAVFVRSEPAGYAMYDTKDTSIFKPGETLVSYVEPIGLSWVPSTTQGKIQTHFTVDFDILNKQGEVLASQKGFGNFTFNGYFRNQEIYATLSIDVTGAPAGDYILRFHFNDGNNKKTASVEQAFTISGP
ncbi:hypothetical protein QO002_002522 [Pararhizobium capsulatum DSM 1112]|uniref:Uncharacterized protein n=1 Tax=Pararhizobium capsulatum DSM 1112 TaxID=1121113 RepID=A0ABU0BQ62_9HYPH|nr:hypothetical protein [Pararhizobium capsulatum]MDQ0320384.1 hypothetical protein [Pararhizobium capsulatum DSM 1112]